MKSSFNTNNKKTKKSKEKTNATRSNAVSDPFLKQAEQNDSQIISGYFLDEKPYKEMVVQRVNNFLYCVLGLLVIFCLICYYFVSCKEIQLNKITKETLEINYENDELQNKLDTLQSYYNIDKAVSKANILERARRVVEVDAVDLPNVNLNTKQNKGKHSVVVSY